MIDKLQSLVNNAVKQIVNQESEIPENQKQLTTDIATNSIVDSISSYLKQSTSSQANTSSSDLISGIKSKAIEVLTSKANLNSALAQKLSGSIMESVAKLLPNGNFNIESLMSLIGGNNSNSNSSKNILGTITKLFKNR